MRWPLLAAWCLNGYQHGTAVQPAGLHYYAFEFCYLHRTSNCTLRHRRHPSQRLQHTAVDARALIVAVIVASGRLRLRIRVLVRAPVAVEHHPAPAFLQQDPNAAAPCIPADTDRMCAAVASAKEHSVLELARASVSAIRQGEWPIALLNNLLCSAIEPCSPADIKEHLLAAAHPLRRRPFLVPPGGRPLQAQRRLRPPRGAGSVAGSILVDVDQALAQSCRGGLQSDWCQPESGPETDNHGAELTVGKAAAFCSLPAAVAHLLKLLVGMYRPYAWSTE